MNYTLTEPCEDCPFREGTENAYTDERLEQFASGEFPCHKTAKLREDKEGCGEFVATRNSLHCAGALIFLEKRGRAHQMMRISERVGHYNRDNLVMSAAVR